MTRDITPIRWVRQEHAKGCSLAVLAMITGESYDTIRAEVDQHRNSTGHSGDWDTSGIGHMDVDRVLFNHGFWTQRVFIGWYRRRLDRTNADDPVRYEMLPGAVWPPEPWAPMHHCEVEQPNRHGHAVFMDGEGRVLDPLREGVFSLSDWPRVNNVAGIIGPGLLTTNGHKTAR